MEDLNVKRQANVEKLIEDYERIVEVLSENPVWKGVAAYCRRRLPALRAKVE